MPGVTDLKAQMAFYGAYHSNATNVTIHRICVPFIQWSAQVLLTLLATNPSWFPAFHYQLGPYIQFEFNWAAVQAIIYVLYFTVLHPTGALFYLPQQALSVGTAIAFAHRAPNALVIASVVQTCTWIAQFIGHGKFEGRAPALLDNIVGALVLAPFFVHLENLFDLGWNPKLHKEVQNAIGVEVTRFRRAEGDKKRAEATRKQ
ncbi:DUF962-domain-containing protein [Vararia minispora EC-137]|uniref:DUF962-domain-containing protein n=1 Tax=Vararia minispora EC-137 TaxID=1314806 RepID=A0ACB8QWT6_9AGAM|nr:DUF962-domain-containing protein [Vararia minispora EC-137]